MTQQPLVPLAQSQPGAPLRPSLPSEPLGDALAKGLPQPPRPSPLPAGGELPDHPSLSPAPTRGLRSRSRPTYPLQWRACHLLLPPPTWWRWRTSRQPMLPQLCAGPLAVSPSPSLLSSGEQLPGLSRPQPPRTPMVQEHVSPRPSSMRSSASDDRPAAA